MFTGVLLAWQYRCCELAASLRQVHGFPVLGLIRRLRPGPLGQQPTASLPLAALAERSGAQPGDGSHVHHATVNRMGAQLSPCSIAMGTPQAFPMASWPRSVMSLGVTLPN